MVHQFKFSEGKTKGQFNNTISHYIKCLRNVYQNPPITTEKLNNVKAYFNRLIKNLEVKQTKRKNK